jgi:hypothetical protein
MHVDAGKLRDAVCASHVYRVKSLDASVTGAEYDARFIELTRRTDPYFTGIDEALSHRGA